VGGVQPFDGVPPVVPVDQVVPLGDEVAERAAVVAERDAAVHAAGGLPDEGRAVEVLVDFAPVLDPNGHGPVGGQLPFGDLEEAFGVGHGLSSLLSRVLRCQDWAAAMMASAASRPSRSASATAARTRL